jgi:hypothetical protein
MGNEPIQVRLGEALFWLLGLLFWVVLASVVRRLLGRRAAGRPRREVWFLVLWLAVETGGYFVLTPFPAVRRLMGLVVVTTLLTGRLAARTCRPAAERQAVWAVAFGGMMLGLLFWGVDLRDAIVQKEAAEATAAWVRQQPHGTIWFTGHWGFQFYGERAGMQPVIPVLSQLRVGDWLILPEERFEQQQLRLPVDSLEEMVTLTLEDLLPLRTVRCYYGGVTPIEHHEGPRLAVRVFRVSGEFLAVAR